MLVEIRSRLPTAVAVTVLASLLGLAPSVQAENWQHLGRGNVRTTGASAEVFINRDCCDRSAAERRDDTVDFNLKYVFEAEQTERGVAYIEIIETVIIDCTRRTSALVAEKSYDSRGRITYENEDPFFSFGGTPPRSAFKPTLPGSFELKAYARLCR